MEASVFIKDDVRSQKGEAAKGFGNPMKYLGLKFRTYILILLHSSSPAKKRKSIEILSQQQFQTDLEQKVSGFSKKRKTYQHILEEYRKELQTSKNLDELQASENLDEQYMFKHKNLDVKRLEPCAGSTYEDKIISIQPDTWEVPFPIAIEFEREGQPIQQLHSMCTDVTFDKDQKKSSLKVTMNLEIVKQDGITTHSMAMWFGILNQMGVKVVSQVCSAQEVEDPYKEQLNKERAPKFVPAGLIEFNPPSLFGEEQNNSNVQSSSDQQMLTSERFSDKQMLNMQMVMHLEKKDPKHLWEKIKQKPDKNIKNLFGDFKHTFGRTRREICVTKSSHGNLYLVRHLKTEDIAKYSLIGWEDGALFPPMTEENKQIFPALEYFQAYLADLRKNSNDHHQHHFKRNAKKMDVIKELASCTKCHCEAKFQNIFHLVKNGKFVPCELTLKSPTQFVHDMREATRKLHDHLFRKENPEFCAMNQVLSSDSSYEESDSDPDYHPNVDDKGIWDCMKITQKAKQKTKNKKRKSAGPSRRSRRYLKQSKRIDDDLSEEASAEFTDSGHESQFTDFEDNCSVAELNSLDDDAVDLDIYVNDKHGGSDDEQDDEQHNNQNGSSHDTLGDEQEQRQVPGNLDDPIVLDSE